MPRTQLPPAHPQGQENPERDERWSDTENYGDRPGSVKDFEAFAKQTGNELLDSSELDGEFHFMLKKIT
ncbi:MAG: hypothetical protein CM1200mP18_12720 [Gammaproteobacteria bacterium]|nr:MAG: hypothetical protein CM1200mP18_12720 [Gammaproteobacteria bacterium]